MPIALRSSFPDFYQNATLFDESIIAGYTRLDSIYERVARVFQPAQTPAKDRVRIKELVGLGRPSEVAEGSEAPTSIPTQGFDKELIVKTFSLAMPVSDEAMADMDGSAAFIDAIAGMGNEFREWQEDMCASMLRSGFGTSLFTGGDGLALFSSAHTFPGGISTPSGATTYSNMSTQPLSASALDAAYASMAETPGPNGKPAPRMPAMLVVPPKLETLALRLTGSTLQPQSSLNDLNALSGKIGVVSWAHLSAAAGGSDTAWYLMAAPGPGGSDLRYYMRTGLEARVERSELKRSATHIVNHRAAFGFRDWRGCWGSTGTGA